MYVTNLYHLYHIHYHLATKKHTRNGEKTPKEAVRRDKVCEMREKTKTTEPKAEP